MGMFTGRAAVGPAREQLPARCDACGAVGVPVEGKVMEGTDVTICQEPTECRRRWQAAEARVNS